MQANAVAMRECGGAPRVGVRKMSAARGASPGPLDVRFISSLPVMQQPAYKVWADKRPVQIVWAVRSTTPDHDVVDDACD